MAQIPQFLSHLGETLRSLGLSSSTLVLQRCLEGKACLFEGRTAEARDSWSTSQEALKFSEETSSQGRPGNDQGLVLGQS